MATTITANQLSVRYGDFVAVAGIDLEISAGQIWGLVGGNGAGKTSILRVLSGIMPPSSGQVSVNGVDMAKESAAAKRKIGYIPDVAELFDTLTVWEHLEFTAITYGVRDYVAEGERLLRWLDLWHKRDTLASNLSRGMLQKVAIACAYLPQPSVLLFDEPLTGLDPSGIRLITDSFQDQAERGATVVVSSHLLPLVEDSCTHLIVLHRGQCVVSGALGDVLQEFDSPGRGSALEKTYFAITQPSDQPLAT